MCIIYCIVKMYVVAALVLNPVVIKLYLHKMMMYMTIIVCIKIALVFAAENVTLGDIDIDVQQTTPGDIDIDEQQTDNIEDKDPRWEILNEVDPGFGHSEFGYNNFSEAVRSLRNVTENIKAITNETGKDGLKMLRRNLHIQLNRMNT